MENKNNCLICSEELEYHTEILKIRCFYCNNDFEANVTCKNNHYVCDACHSMSANEFIKHFCLNTIETDTYRIANILMSNPKVKMHGPEHHFLIPAALLVSYYNILKNSYELDKKIKQAVTFVKENFKLEIPLTKEFRCRYNYLNRECLQGDCEYYR